MACALGLPELASHNPFVKDLEELGYELGFVGGYLVIYGLPYLDGQGALQHGGAAVAKLCWTAGLAAYRLGQFERAARHFEALTQAGQSAARTFSAASFWAARSWMRAGSPERVMTLYQRAAAEPQTFYGLLAVRLLGREVAPSSKPTHLFRDATPRAGHRGSLR